MLPQTIERITENKDVPDFCVIERFDAEVIPGAK
jgi:hypothetical protein